MSEAAPTPGHHMRTEITEQPDVFAALLSHREEFADVAARIRQRRPRFALLAARGSSDHAAQYAKYLVEVLLQIPVGLASPSTTTLYGAEPDLTDVLVISVSQSGSSPDLVEVTESGRRQGATTVAVTNASDSALDEAAEFGVHIHAGSEKAVAATKTYTATMFALYLLIDALRGGGGESAADIPRLARQVLDDTSEAVDAMVQRYRFKRV